MATKIQMRRDTAANWTSANPLLSQGEEALETDTGRVKRGDGSAAWTALPYAGLQGVVTAKGDLIAGTAPATAARLGVGTDGQVLTASAAAATGLAWATPAAGSGGTAAVGRGARFFRNSSLSIPATTVQAIPLNSTAFNDDTTYYNLNTSNGQVSIYKAGLYLFTFYSSITSSVAGSSSVFIRQNGVTVQEDARYAPASTVSRFAPSTPVRCAANDIFTFLAYLPGSGTADGTTAAKDVGLAIAYLGS